MKCPLCGGTTFLKSQPVILGCEQEAEAKVCEHCGYILAFNDKVVQEQAKRKSNLQKLKAQLKKAQEHEKSYKPKVPSFNKEKAEVKECRNKLILLIKHDHNDPEIRTLEKRIKELDEIIDRKASSLTLIKYREILRNIDYLKDQIDKEEALIRQNQY